MACRRLYNTALEQRQSVYAQRGVSLSRYAQEAELKGPAGGVPGVRGHPQPCLAGCAGAARQGLSSVLPAYPQGDAGLPALSGRDRFNSFTYKSSATGATSRITAFWCSRRLAGWPCAGVARWRGRPRRSRSGGKPMAGMSASPVPMCPCSPCRPLDKRPG